MEQILTQQATFVNLPAAGNVTFPSRGATRFRSKLTTVGQESVSVRLKDRESKQQWNSGVLKISNIVNSSNAAIPSFQSVDYATCFEKCLQEASRETQSGDTGTPTNDCDWDFYQENDTWCLELSLSLRLWDLVSKPTCRIPMKPIDLDTGTLMAKIRDQDELLQRLGSALERAIMRISALEISKSVHLVVTTEKSAAPNEVLVWSQLAKDKSASEKFALSEDRTIQFKVAEVYAIHLNVIHQNKDSDCGVCAIHFGSETVHTFYGPHDTGGGAILDAMCLLEVQAGELVSVANTGDGEVEEAATMSIFLV